MPSYVSSTGRLSGRTRAALEAALRQTRTNITTGLRAEDMAISLHYIICFANKRPQPGSGGSLPAELCRYNREMSALGNTLRYDFRDRLAAAVKQHELSVQQVTYFLMSLGEFLPHDRVCRIIRAAPALKQRLDDIGRQLDVMNRHWRQARRTAAV